MKRFLALMVLFPPLLVAAVAGPVPSEKGEEQSFRLTLPESGTERFVDPGKAGPHPALDLALVAYNATAIADLATTYQLLGQSGYREANPLLGSFGNNPGALVAVKTGVAFGVTYGLTRLGKERPKLAFWMTVAGIGLNSFAAIHNLRQKK